MPAIFVNILEGKTQEQMDLLVKKLTEAAVEAVDVLPEKVSVFINEFPANRVARNGTMFDKQ
jgi:4-oxalocrotonate tautomerase family enzyme